MLTPQGVFFRNISEYICRAVFVDKNQVDFTSITRDSSLLAKSARREILKMTNTAKASHVASSLSVVDVLAVLYSGITNITPNNYEDMNRDVVILSKGHAASAIYSILALKGFFELDWLEQYCQDGAQLGGHVTSKNVPGIELSTGSLGHGLPYGLGIALARKRANEPGEVYVVMSDGECDEGTTWESALIANHYNLDNLCVIIDRNRIQSLTFTEETIALEPFSKKWEAFNWNVTEVDGHSYSELATVINQKSIKPKCIIANTIKGKGVDFMENLNLWHYKHPDAEQLEVALKQINRTSS
jgi:transketolase